MFVLCQTYLALAQNPRTESRGLGIERSQSLSDVPDTRLRKDTPRN